MCGRSHRRAPRRVGHPAPFPVELPEKLIALYTYTDDLVLDPFMGSGTALVAAARMGRRYVGYDLDPIYVDIARRRVAIEGAPVDVSTLLADPVKGAKKLAEEALVGGGVHDHRRATGASSGLECR